VLEGIYEAQILGKSIDPSVITTAANSLKGMPQQSTA
jgi:hypothetical protein